MEQKMLQQLIDTDDKRIAMEGEWTRECRYKCMHEDVYQVIVYLR